eukprot:TRINITY_DN4846_c0_g1_i1.p1 TRINITY_DN4846_c0_g1~~TRINITY_DN4846_c0_g1_i1.p1  ORF type:complete len:904 (+),score=338.43 TRINITY_DN4846_c0_g1_i1:161-2872(+)
MSDVTDKVHNKDEEIEHDESSEADAGEEVDSDEYDDNEYCICRGRDDGTFMIQCDRCTEWYHGKCIQVTRRKVKEVERWVCPFCEAKLKAGITPTAVTHRPKKQSGAHNTRASSKTKQQPRTRGDDDNPRKRKRQEEGTSGPEVKRAKNEQQSIETKNTEHKNIEHKNIEHKGVETKSSEVKPSESALRTSKEGRAALQKSDKSKSAPSPPPLRHSTGTSEAQWQQQRDGVRTKLVAMLQRVSTQAESDARLQEIAHEIEETLVEHVPRAQYLSKFRALMLSLPKNSELCNDVLSGAVSGAALVRMDEEQWAPKALQDLRAKYQHYLPVKPTDDEVTAGTVPPASTSVPRDSEERKKSDEHVPSEGEEKSGEDRSESAVHEESSRDAVSRDSAAHTADRDHVTDAPQQTPPGSPYQALDESDSEHVTGPNVALDDIEIDVRVDDAALEPIEFTEPLPEPEPEPEHKPAPEPQSVDLYDPDTSMNDEDDEPVVAEEHLEPSEYIDQIWKGLLTYQKLIPDVALRSVHLEGAKVEHLMGDELVIDGRMDLHKLLDYLPQIDLSQSRQRTTLLFKPEVGYEEYYHRMYEHLTAITRGGVIRVDEHTLTPELFKEVYLVPVHRRSPPPFIQAALKALGDSPAHRHLIGQTDELLLGVFLTRRMDLAALPARSPRTPKRTPTPVPEVHVPPPQSQLPKSHPGPEAPKSAPHRMHTPAVQTPNVMPAMSLPPNPNLPPNPTTFLPPQLQSLLSNLIGQALVPGGVPNPTFNPNPAPYVPPQQNRGYPPQSYSAAPHGYPMSNSAPEQYEDGYNGDYEYREQYNTHDYHNDAYSAHNTDYTGSNEYNNSEYAQDYNQRGGYNRYNNTSNNRFRGHNNHYNSNSNNRRGGGFRSGGGGGGRFRSNQRGRRY